MASIMFFDLFIWLRIYISVTHDMSGLKECRLGLT